MSKKNLIIMISSIIFFILIIAFLYGYYFIYNEEDNISDNIINVDEKAEEVRLKNKYIICIDPGHGGEVSETAPDLQEEEKEDVLKLSLLVRDKLKSKNIKVIMTREDDTSIELSDRAIFANENNADYFVSLHRNISDVGSDINGAETWKALNKGYKNDILAESIHNELLEFGFNDRKVREGSQTNIRVDYIVNRETTMPSVILELGFMTNENDNDLFRNNTDELADAITRGIKKALYEIENYKEKE